jgi:hypothetical protein
MRFECVHDHHHTADQLTLNTKTQGAETHYANKEEESPLYQMQYDD